MKTRNPIIVIFTLLIGALVLTLVNTTYQSYYLHNWSSRTIDISQDDSIIKSFFAYENISDTLQYADYKKQKMDFDNRKAQQDILNKGYDFNTLSCDFFGVSTNTDDGFYNDTFDFKQMYFFTFEVKGFKDFDTKYCRNNTDAYLVYPVWDTVNKNEDDQRNGHYTSKKINVRYSSNNERNVVHIPINKAMYIFFKILIILIGALVFIFLGFYFLVLPFKIFQQIAKGKAFSAINIEHLNGMYNVAFYFCLINSFLPSLLSLAISNIIPKEFAIESFATILFSNIGYYIFTIILYYVRASFIKGYILQEENALTI